MLKIAYDITAVAESPNGGVARVSYHTLAQAADHPEIDPIGFYRKGIRSNIDIGNVALVKHRPYHRWTGRRFDVAHSLCHRLLEVRARRTVYTVHDAWSLKPNDYQDAAFQRKVGERLRREISRADHVVTISETTRRHLLNEDLILPEKCTVALLGYSPPADLQKPAAADALEGKKYVLYVGCLEVRKNIAHLLKAVRPLNAVHLVVAGNPGHGFRETIEDELGSFPQERLHRLNVVTRAELPWLYRNAVATLLPSWEEGFGLPILEAMANSCPIVTSNRSANAEVGEDAAILIDPNDPSESQRAIERLLDDPVYRNTVVERGRKRAGQFSWERYFDTLVAVYRHVLQKF